MRRSVDVAVIGAGQAGLATSWHLAQANVDHVLLDSGRVGETRRSRRWDSFCLVTPNWTVQLPGPTYDGPEPKLPSPMAKLLGNPQQGMMEGETSTSGSCMRWVLS
ncbi:MAG: FAD-dependent oxidoreductase [Candidatus Dormiibacterota bacterium]